MNRCYYANIEEIVCNYNLLEYPDVKAVYDYYKDFEAKNAAVTDGNTECSENDKIVRAIYKLICIICSNNHCDLITDNGAEPSLKQLACDIINAPEHQRLSVAKAILINNPKTVVDFLSIMEKVIRTPVNETAESILTDLRVLCKEMYSRSLQTFSRNSMPFSPIPAVNTMASTPPIANVDRIQPVKKQIASARQAGYNIVHALDASGRCILQRNGELRGYTADTITIKECGGNIVHVYDVNGNHLSQFVEH